MRGFVRPLVRALVRWSIRVHPKSGKLSVYVSVLEGGLGVDEGWLPLPTRPQRYCDPASLDE